jgi:O-antigen/teichoic acid export membrane protein
MNFARLTTPQKISAIAMLVVAVGAFLPWASLLGINAYGIQGDGVITLILAVAGMVLLALTSALVKPDRTQNKVSGIACLVLAVLVTLIGLNDTTNFAAIGIYLTLLGGIAWIVGAGWQIALRTKSVEEVPAPSPEPGQPS